MVVRSEFRVPAREDTGVADACVEVDVRAGGLCPDGQRGVGQNRRREAGSELPEFHRKKLGAKFDQRLFHDAILALGSVPLPVLEERMAKFIADGGVNPPSGTR